MVDFWTRLKNHLNESLQSGDKKRSVIISEMQRGMQVEQIQNTGEILPHRTIHGFSITTFDCYINYLHKAEYLFRPRRGWYGLADTIPSDLSIEDVKNLPIGWEMEDSLENDETVILKVLKNRPIRKMKKKEEFFKKEEFAI
jgi:hypothetical protein